MFLTSTSSLKKLTLSLIILLLTLTFLTNPILTQEEIINISNYNYPKIADARKDEFILAILGTNDIHGQAYERDFKAGNETYKVGGYKLLSGAISKIREEFKDQFLWFDAGDQFTGTVENIETTGQLMVDFYNALKVDSVAIGNHEWDNKESQLKAWMAKELGRYYKSENSFFGFPRNANYKDSINTGNKHAKINRNVNVIHNTNHSEDVIKKDKENVLEENLNDLQQLLTANLTNSFLQTESIDSASSSTSYSNFLGSLEQSSLSLSKPKTTNLYLAANLALKDSFNKTTDDLPNRMSTKIFSFLNGKIKIGLIGLTTMETNEKTSGFSNKKFDLLSYKPTVERLSKELKAKGANAIIIISHVGMTCKSPTFTPEQVNEYYKLALRDAKGFADKKQTETCKGEMIDLLQSLEPNTVQAVIGGHVHESIHHFINGVPVIQNPMSNLFTNVLYLKFRKDFNGNFNFIAEDTLIEGPIPLCSKIYTNNLRCNVYQDTSEQIKLSEFNFHGSQFSTDPQVQRVFDKYQALTAEIERMKQNFIFKTELRLERSASTENILGNLVADIHKALTQADVGMVAPGNLRYIWEKGFVSEYEITNMFPFRGDFGKYNVSGANLKKIFQTLQEGKSGFYAFSGVNMTINRYNETYAKLDLGSVKLWSGEVIQDERMYSFASNEFELLGGDDMKNFVVNGTITINATAIEAKQPILPKFIEYLKKMKLLSEADSAKYLGRLNIVNLFRSANQDNQNDSFKSGFDRNETSESLKYDEYEKKSLFLGVKSQ